MAMEFAVDLKDNLSESAGKMGDSLGELSKGMGGLSGALDELVPGLGLAAGAILGIGAAAVGAAVGLVSIVSKGIETSDMLQAKFGAPTIAMFDSLGEATGKTRDELGTLAEKYRAMGITDVPKLRTALLAASSAEAMLGASGASALQTLMSKVQLATEVHQGLKLATRGLGNQLASAGVSLDEVAAKMGTTGPQLAAQLKRGTVNAQAFGDALQQAIIEKGAGPLDLLAHSWDSMWKQAQQQVFSAIFDPGTESGKALRAGIEKIKEVVGDLAKKVIPYLIFGFKQLIIWGLQLYLALRPHFELIKTVLKGIGIAILGIVGIAAVAAAVVILPFVLMAAAGMALWAVIGYVIGKFGEWYDAVVGFVSGAAKALSDWVSGAVDTAKAFVGGLISGITNAIPALISAVGGMVTAAKDKVKSMLGIASPSKVMAGIGVNVAHGFAGGIEGGRGKVAAAAGSMADSAAGGAAGPSAGAGGDYKGGGSSVVVNVEVKIDGAGKTAHEITTEMVTLVFEQYALSQGLGNG